MVMYRRGRCCPCKLEASSDSSQGFGRTIEGVVVGGVSDELAPDCVLLVGEGEESVGDTLNHLCVMQRRNGGEVRLSVDGEVDVLEFERLGASGDFGGEGIFGGSEEPVEGDDDQVYDVGVEHTPGGVGGVEGSPQGSDDSEICGVGSSGWVVFVSQGFEKRRE